MTNNYLHKFSRLLKKLCFKNSFLFSFCAVYMDKHIFEVYSWDTLILINIKFKNKDMVFYRKWEFWRER